MVIEWWSVQWNNCHLLPNLKRTIISRLNKNCSYFGKTITKTVIKVSSRTMNYNRPTCHTQYV